MAIPCSPSWTSSRVSQRESHGATAAEESCEQKRSYDHFVRQSEDLVAIGQYILDNPVRRGLAQSLGDYPWAGLVDPLPL